MVELDLTWYTTLVASHKPFTYLSYGDGEILALTGKRSGTFTQYREAITPKLVEELQESLFEPGLDIFRGTDPFLADWRTYGGRDVASVREVSEALSSFLAGRTVQWVNGVVWDEAVRNGGLSSFLRAMHGRNVIVVGNRKLRELEFLHPIQFHEVPDTGAAAEVDCLERDILSSSRYARPDVYVMCMGLGAGPLIMRIRRYLPAASFLDLGSTFDVFVGLGGQRGWRRELYDNPTRLSGVLDANLEGVCDPDCLRRSAGASANS